MRAVFSDERRVQHYLDIEAALARVQARLGIIPSEAAEEICRHCHVAEFDLARLKTQTERIGYPVLPVVQQLVGLCRGRARRVVPLGRHDPGHHRHRDRPADPRRARPGRAGSAGDRRRARRARPPLPRHADGGAQQPAAGGADHLRLQGGRAARRLPAPPRSGCRSCARGCWSASSAAPRATSPRSATDGPQGPGGADGRARPRPARDRLAHHARPHRRGRLLPRPRHRHARQDRRWT